MLRLLWFSFIAFLFLSVQFRTESKTVFGISVCYQANGSMYTIIVYFDNGITRSNVKYLSLKEFAHFASGDWPSIYNRNRINLFEINDVEGGLIYDSTTLKMIPYCSALDSLWKIRYRYYPFVGKSDQGWSNDDVCPSLNQKKYLFDRYGNPHIDSKYFLDTSFWKILRDVRDPNWIAHYKSL